MAWSASGIGAIDSHHPLALGLVARNGPYQANHAARQADVLLALGVRFDDRTSSSWLPGYSFTIPPTKLIHVDIDPDEIARNYPVALGLMADVRTFLRQVLAELETRRKLGGRGRVARANGSAPSTAIARNGTRSSRRASSMTPRPIHPQRAAHEIDKALPEDAILVSDIGVHHNWLHPVLQAEAAGFADRLAWASARWASASPACWAPQFAAPERPCVSVCGDGAFFMHASVLGTAVEYNLPVVWVVLEQFRLRLDPRIAARLSRRPRACDRLPPSRHRRALQSRLRRHGALRRHRRA